MNARSLVSFVAVFGVAVVSACSSSSKNAECAKLAGCCSGDAACQKLADQNTEADCKTAQVLYCGATNGDGGSNMDGGGKPDAEADSAPGCSVAKFSECGSGKGCCATPYTCGWNPINANAKVCCVELGATCGVGEECCQGATKIRNTCEQGKCCTMEGEICSSAADCCPSAPNCTQGACAK